MYTYIYIYTYTVYRYLLSFAVVVVVNVSCPPHRGRIRATRRTRYMVFSCPSLSSLLGARARACARVSFLSPRVPRASAQPSPHLSRVRNLRSTGRLAPLQLRKCPRSHAVTCDPLSLYNDVRRSGHRTQRRRRRRCPSTVPYFLSVVANDSPLRATMGRRGGEL